MLPNTQILFPDSGNQVLTWTVANQTCTMMDTLRIRVNVNPVALAGPDQTLDSGVPLLLQGNTPAPGLSGTWSVNPEIPLTNPVNPALLVGDLLPGSYTFIGFVSGNSCPAALDEVLIVIKDFFIPDGFSPNNDGKNDFFVIRGIDKINDAVLTIFNRWGSEVYSNENYQNTWSGTNKSNDPLGDDTYYYILKVPSWSAYSGFVVLKR